MKIVLAGSIGNIGKPLTQALVQKGHWVTVISSKVESKNDRFRQRICGCVSSKINTFEPWPIYDHTRLKRSVNFHWLVTVILFS